MKRVRRVLVIVSLGLACAGAMPLLAAEALYGYALRELGPPPPVPAPPLPPDVVHAFWIAAGERLPPRVERLAAWRYGWALAYDRASLARHRPGERVASFAARAWVSRRSPPRGLKSVVIHLGATVWASRHWDAGELTRVWTDAAWFGRGARGLDAAARSYFGKTPDALGPGETALLVALARSPARLDPACFPDRARAARDGALKQMLSSGAIGAADHRAAVAGPLGVTERRCERASDAAPAPPGSAPAGTRGSRTAARLARPAPPRTQTHAAHEADASTRSPE